MQLHSPSPASNRSSVDGSVGIKGVGGACLGQVLHQAGESVVARYLQGVGHASIHGFPFQSRSVLVDQLARTISRFFQQRRVQFHLEAASSRPSAEICPIVCSHPPEPVLSGCQFSQQGVGEGGCLYLLITSSVVEGGITGYLNLILRLLPGRDETAPAFQVTVGVVSLSTAPLAGLTSTGMAGGLPVTKVSDPEYWLVLRPFARTFQCRGLAPSKIDTRGVTGIAGGKGFQAQSATDHSLPTSQSVAGRSWYSSPLEGRPIGMGFDTRDRRGQYR